MSVGDGTMEGQASRQFRGTHLVRAGQLVTPVLCAVALGNLWIAFAIGVVLHGLGQRADGRAAVATLSGFCWIGIGAIFWSSWTGLPGAGWIGLALGAAVFAAHRLLLQPKTAPAPESHDEHARDQVERAARDALVIVMVLLALFSFFRVESSAIASEGPAQATLALR